MRDVWNGGTVHNPSEQIREEDRVIREIRA